MEIKEALDLLNEQDYLSNNELNKKKYKGKSNVGSTLSTLKKDAGNVEHNISQFNKGFAGGADGSSGGSGGEACGESLQLQEAENDDEHGTHQKYRDWNKDKEEFTQGRYTPYVTTKRVKRTLDKMGFEPVEANGIMMDIQRGNAEPRHVTLETTDDGQTWSFRNERGSKMFDLEEDIKDDGTYTIQGIPYDNIKDDAEELLNSLDRDEIEERKAKNLPVITWNQLMDGIVKVLCYKDYKDVVDVAADLITFLHKNGYDVEMSGNDFYTLEDEDGEES